MYNKLTFCSTLNSWIGEFVVLFFWCHEQVLSLSLPVEKINHNKYWQGMPLQSNQYCALSLSYFEEITNTLTNSFDVFTTLVFTNSSQIEQLKKKTNILSIGNSVAIKPILCLELFLFGKKYKYNEFIRCFYQLFLDWTVEKENQYLVGQKEALLTCSWHQKNETIFWFFLPNRVCLLFMYW